MCEPVRVAGIGVVSAFGSTLTEFRDALLGGRTAIARVGAFDVGPCRSTIAAAIANFDATAWVPPMKLRRLDRTAAYAIAAMKLARTDAGLSPEPEGDDERGVVLGTWSGGGGSTEQFLDALIRRGPTGAPALLFDSTVANSAAATAALEHGLRGPNMTVSHKEASGLAAVCEGVALVRERRASELLAGGSDALFETFFKAYDRFAVMSPASSAGRPTAPFDAARSGFVLGEGAAGLWLERAGSRVRGHGEILGVAAAGASVGLNAWPDRPEPLVRVMELALADAGLSADAVDVVYASANASREFDAVEAAALSRLFAGTRTVVTSIKGAIGEAGVGGSLSCAAAFACGAAGRVPPVAGLETPDASTRSLTLATAAMEAPGPVTLVNSFASGGALFSAVLRVASA